jgi:hypothetical protein
MGMQRRRALPGVSSSGLKREVLLAFYALGITCLTAEVASVDASATVPRGRSK